jgi:hypothetical protein
MKCGTVATVLSLFAVAVFVTGSLVDLPIVLIILAMGCIPFAVACGLSCPMSNKLH